MSDIKNNFIYKIIFFFLFSFFTFGFIIQEDAAGGGKNDFIFHIYNNIKLFKNYNFFDIPWNYYDSSSLPLYYLITKYLIPLKEPLVFKLFTFFLSLICIYIFYKILKKKYEELSKHNHIFLLIAITPLLSPYFRTSAFWGLEENKIRCTWISDNAFNLIKLFKNNRSFRANVLSLLIKKLFI